MSTRCIEYGKAVSGICQSFYDKIQLNCNFATIPSPRFENRTHVCPPRGSVDNWNQPLPLANLKAVPDGTAYCLKSENDWPIIASRKLEEVLFSNFLYFTFFHLPFFDDILIFCI